MKKSFRSTAVSTAQREAMRGFTLIELMVVLAIIAIVAAIAVPQYAQSVYKAHRTDAKTALTDLAQREEKFYSINNAYTATLSNLYPSATGTSLNIQSGSVSYYVLTIPTVTAASTTSAAYFQAQAAPQNGQTSDTCGTMTIDSNGATGAAVTTGCW